MFIEVIKNNGVEYIRLVQSRRKKTADGKSVSKKEVVCSLGWLSKFDDGKPEFVQRLKKSFKDGTPLIEELMPYVQSENKTVRISFAEGDKACIGSPKYLAPCILDNVFSAPGIDEPVSRRTHTSHRQRRLQRKIF